MTASEPSDLIRSVSRALRILEQAARAGRPVSVKVLARRCDLNLSTTYHLVRTLCYEGYLARCPDGGYVAGSKIAERFHELVGAFHRPPEATEVLGHLAAVTGHTAYLARLAGGRLVVLAVAEGPRSPWIEDLQVGLDTAPHATALGKALLLTLPRRVRRSLVQQHGMRRFTATTPGTVDDVEAELSGLRPGEPVEEHGQFRDGVSCAGIAVPSGEPDTWWAVALSARGLGVPGEARAGLRRAAADLAARATV